MPNTVLPTGIVIQAICLSGSSACQPPIRAGRRSIDIRNVGARLDEA